MRTLLILGVVCFAAFTAGWFKIHRDGDETTIRINKAEIRSDARRAIDRGREILDKRDSEYGTDQDSYSEYADDPYPDYDNRYTRDSYEPAPYSAPRYEPPVTDDRYSNRYDYDRR